MGGKPDDGKTTADRNFEPELCVVLATLDVEAACVTRFSSHAANSELFTWDRLKELPNFLSPDSMQVWPGASIELGTSWRVRFPKQQWWYGLLIPVQRPKKWPKKRRAIVSIDLEVHSGRIGIAGLDESCTNLTTGE